MKGLRINDNNLVMNFNVYLYSMETEEEKRFVFQVSFMDDLDKDTTTFGDVAELVNKAISNDEACTFDGFFLSTDRMKANRVFLDFEIDNIKQTYYKYHGDEYLLYLSDEGDVIHDYVDIDNRIK